MKSNVRPILAATALLAAGCKPSAPGPAGPVPSPATPATNALGSATTDPGPPWFDVVPPSSGLDFRHSTGKTGRFYLPEMETGGVGLIDYDGDGWLDIVCIDGGSLEPGKPTAPKHRLYRNLGGWKFADVTASSGLVCPDGYGMGCAVGDYDGDGRPDLYVTQLGSNRLFRNKEAGWTSMEMEGYSATLDPKYGDFITPEQSIPATMIPSFSLASLCSWAAITRAYSRSSIGITVPEVANAYFSFTPGERGR